MGNVPVVNLQHYLEGRAGPGTMKALDKACRDHGFFLLTGHGLEAPIAAAWRSARGFFGADAALKRSVARSRDNALGYFDRELTKQKRDQKEVFDYAPQGQDNADTGFGCSKWPLGLVGFRETLLAYADVSAELTVQILGMLYVTLGLSASDVPESIGTKHTGFVRLNHYPVDDPVAENQRHGLNPLGDMALHHHTDPGVITLLLQDEVGGLQTYSQHGGWIDVPPHPGAIVVNMSDMMQVLTNDNYRASLHRVLPVPGRDRYSIVYFSMPSHAALIAPQAELYDREPHYRSFTWAEFISGRLGDNFADYGTEDIQISQFRASQESSPAARS